jgi:hypothetical protein
LATEPQYSFRSKFVDPDFRRMPKSNTYCFVCQKDITKAVPYLGHAAFGCVEVIHPEDREIADRELDPADNLGLLPVGSDCAKRIGYEWFVRPGGETSE